MKLPRRGEKGFTLIELLIVVAILGILAAVIVPNVSRFFGRGEEEARSAEKHSVQLAVAALMTETELSDLTSFGEWTDATILEFPNDGTDIKPSDDMSAFPDTTGGSDYILYPDYLHTLNTKYTYTVDASGTVFQYDENGHKIIGEVYSDGEHTE